MRRLLLVVFAIAMMSVEAYGQRGGVPEGVTAVRNIAYVENGHERQKLDLYLPKDAKAPTPVIVWIHGGAWLGGSKENPPVLPVVRLGYAAASINYRLSQHATFPAQIEDCKAAIRWLRANAKSHRLDAGHIGVWGASAGGHLVALLGTSGGVKEWDSVGGSRDQSSSVQCVVDFFGPTDFTKMGGRHDDPQSPEARLIGGSVQEKKAEAVKANPITYIDAKDPPFLILHGEADRTVPHGQSVLLQDALKKAGVESKLVSLPGAGHGGPQFQTPENRKLILQFFDRHLKAK